MKTKLWTTSLVLGVMTIAQLSETIPQAMADKEVQFSCETSFDQITNSRLPTTFALTSRGKIAVIRWQTKTLGIGTPQQKCEKVTPRLQKAYDDGIINIITNGTINNHPVICTTKGYSKPCDTLLITLRPEDNSQDVLNHLKDIFNGRQVGDLRHRSGAAQIYYQIDINKFLQSAPVEKE